MAYDEISDGKREAPDTVEKISGGLLRGASAIVVDDLERLRLVTRNRPLVSSGEERFSVLPAVRNAIAGPRVRRKAF